MTLFYIFVEGSRDKIVFNTLFGNKLCLLGDDFNIVEYASMKDDKINNFIKGINSMENCDYIFVADQDGNKTKKDDILKKYSFLDKNKTFISVFEIESWIAAGISDDLIKKYKIKFHNRDTSSLTKEAFEKIVPEHMSIMQFISHIINDYSLEKALDLNMSFKTLYDYLYTKKAS